MMKLVLGFGVKYVGLIIPIIILFSGFVPYLKSAINKYPLVTAGPSISESVSWPTPDTLIGGIPVFNRFDSMKPLFGFDNDTTYVINFWATWCKPCVEELPIFESLNSNAKKDKIKVILVSLDFPEQVVSKLVPFVKKHQLNSTVVLLLDSNFNKWIDEVSSDWSGAIPATYIYKQDQSRLVKSKFKNLEELRENIKPFL